MAMSRVLLLAAAFVGITSGAPASLRASEQPEKDDKVLPPVRTVLSRAAQSLQGFADQARQMQERVAERQKMARAALEQQKESYERQLLKQDHENYDLAEATNVIRSHAKELRRSTHQQRKIVEEVQESNRRMHQVLVSLQPKLDTVSTFIADSLSLSDANETDRLRDLQAHQEVTMEKFRAKNAVDIGDRSDKALALLQESVGEPEGEFDAQKAAKTMEELVEHLSRSLEQLTTAQEVGEAQLKQHFLAAFASGQQKQQDLLKEQRELNGTVVELQSLGRDLTVAYEHSTAAHKALSERIRALEGFMRSFMGAGHMAIRAADRIAAEAAAGTAPNAA